MTLYWKVLSVPFTDSREPGAPLYSCSVHEAPGLYAGHREKEQRFCLWLCMDSAPFTAQLLFGKLAILDVWGGGSHHISQLQAGALSITFEIVTRGHPWVLQFHTDT